MALSVTCNGCDVAAVDEGSRDYSMKAAKVRAAFPKIEQVIATSSGAYPTQALPFGITTGSIQHTP